VILQQQKEKSLNHSRLFMLARLAGIEPTTPWFVAKYSIQLSYSRAGWYFNSLRGRRHNAQGTLHPCQMNNASLKSPCMTNPPKIRACLSTDLASVLALDRESERFVSQSAHGSKTRLLAP
jgi:hypothetical protein